MIRLRRFVPMISLAFLVIPIGVAGSRSDGESTHLKDRVFQFTYKAEIGQIPEGTRELRVWLPYPTTNPHQEIYDVKVSGPSAATVYTEPQYENSILYLLVQNPSAGLVTVELAFKVERIESQYPCFLSGEFRRSIHHFRRSINRDYVIAFPQECK